MFHFPMRAARRIALLPASGRCPVVVPLRAPDQRESRAQDPARDLSGATVPCHFPSTVHIRRATVWSASSTSFLRGELLSAGRGEPIVFDRTLQALARRTPIWTRAVLCAPDD